MDRDETRRRVFEVLSSDVRLEPPAAWRELLEQQIDIVLEVLWPEVEAEREHTARLETALRAIANANARYPERGIVSGPGSRTHTLIELARLALEPRLGGAADGPDWATCQTCKHLVDTPQHRLGCSAGRGEAEG